MQNEWHENSMCHKYICMVTTPIVIVCFLKAQMRELVFSQLTLKNSAGTEYYNLWDS